MHSTCAHQDLLTTVTEVNHSPLAADSSTLIRGLGRRYLMILVIVAILLTIDQAVLQPHLIRLNGMAPVINLAGRQRMLSQRMAKDLLALAQARGDHDRRATELKNSLVQWLTVHQALQFGDAHLRLPGTTSKEILRAFQSLEPHVAAMRHAVESVVADHSTSTETVEAMLDHEPRYLETMDRIVGLFEEEASQQVRVLRWLGIAATSIVLGLTIGLAYVVLKPATEVIRTQMRQLTANEERFRLLIERMHDGLAVFDLQGRILYVNDRFAKILQRDREELLNQSLLKHLTGPHFFRFVQQLSDVWKYPQATWELDWQAPSGELCITLAAFGKTYGDSIEETLGFLVITDITPLKLAEKNLQEAHDALESRVAERTQELKSANHALAREIAERQAAEDRNRQLQSELAHASRVTSLGQFATGLAHEINQPLGAISNYAEALSVMMNQRRLVDPEIQRTMDRIRDASLRAGQIVSRMRNFLKRRTTSRSPEKMNSLIQDVLDLCASEARLHRVSIHCELEETEEVTILVDPIQIQQVLVNLIQNSLHAMATGQRDRRLTIQSFRSADSLQIVLEDTGPGFPPQMLTTELAPFQSSKESGLGMGLSISQSLIAAHDGEFWIENASHGGARLTLTLPIATVPESLHAADGLCRR